MMTIDLTRNEVLDLMKELPVDHWLQVRLLDNLNVGAGQKIQTVAPSFETAHNCEWMFYGMKCDNTEDIIQVERGRFFCGKHTGLICRKCGNPADHGCPEELQFVCGAPLCKNCTTCS